MSRNMSQIQTHQKTLPNEITQIPRLPLHPQHSLFPPSPSYSLCNVLLRHPSLPLLVDGSTPPFHLDLSQLRCQPLCEVFQPPRQVEILLLAPLQRPIIRAPVPIVIPR